MGKNYALLVMLALTGCAAPSTPGSATTNSDGSITIVIAAKRVADCKAHGGCGLYSRAELMRLAESAAEAGARQTCPSKGAMQL